MKNPVFAITVLSLALLVAACASPAEHMSMQEVSTLSDKQLCDLKRMYRWEKKTELEIGRRNLNCDPDYIECASRGVKPNSPEMAVCIDQLRENRELKEKIEAQQRELERIRNDAERMKP